jgi:hypothetical protein
MLPYFQHHFSLLIFTIIDAPIFPTSFFPFDFHHDFQYFPINSTSILSIIGNIKKIFPFPNNISKKEFLSLYLSSSISEHRSLQTRKLLLIEPSDEKNGKEQI